MKCDCLCHILPSGNKECKCCIRCSFCGKLIIENFKPVNRKTCKEAKKAGYAPYHNWHQYIIEKLGYENE